jgi:hypothetical protein
VSRTGESRNHPCHDESNGPLSGRRHQGHTSDEQAGDLQRDQDGREYGQWRPATPGQREGRASGEQPEHDSAARTHTLARLTLQVDFGQDA